MFPMKVTPREVPGFKFKEYPHMRRRSQLMHYGAADYPYWRVSRNNRKKDHPMSSITEMW